MKKVKVTVDSVQCTESIKFIEACYKSGLNWESKLGNFETKSFYFPKEQRQLFLEKRNERFNLALEEIQEWGYGLNIRLLRPWQENAADVKAAIAGFLDELTDTTVFLAK